MVYLFNALNNPQVSVSVFYADIDCIIIDSYETW